MWPSLEASRRAISIEYSQYSLKSAIRKIEIYKPTWSWLMVIIHIQKLCRTVNAHLVHRNSFVMSTFFLSFSIQTRRVPCGFLCHFSGHFGDHLGKHTSEKTGYVWNYLKHWCKLTHLSRMVFPTIIKLTSPFPLKSCWVSFFICIWLIKYSVSKQWRPRSDATFDCDRLQPS